MSSWYDQLNVRTTEEILTSMDIEPLTNEDILKQNVKDLQKELNEAHTRIHQLQDVINEVAYFVESAREDLEQSIHRVNKRWVE